MAVAIKNLLSKSEMRVWRADAVTMNAEMH